MKDKKSISHRFQKRLAVIVAIALTVTTLFLFIINTNINNRNYSDIIASTLTDVERDIEDTSDINMLAKTKSIKKEVVELLQTMPLDDTYAINDALRDIVKDEDLSEMSIANKDNIVIYSSKDEYIGFDMDSSEDTIVFDKLNHGESEIVQPVRENAYKGEGSYDQYNKYAGVPLEGTGYLQVAINSQQFQKQIDEKVNYIAANRHIGQTGFVIISDYRGNIVSYAGSDASSYKDETLDSLGIDFDENKDLGESIKCSINGVEYLAEVRFIESYYIIGAVPMSEVQSFRNRSVLMNTVTEIIIFILMFLFIRMMINSLIVSKIHNINGSLRQIIEGMLDTKINEYSSTEFSDLSNDINSTVTSLQESMKREQEKIVQELEFAKSIQLSVLPKLSTIKKYGQDFELYATMDTAKEVGGDFYDFYMIDESKLAFLIADVSGKGVPAAMFMMTSKTMLKNLVDSGIGLSESFTKANEILCESNDAGMFVTVWMGILDLKSGNLEYVNAGHNYPLVFNEEGEFEYLTGKPGFVLTGMEDMKYRSQKIRLKPGDKIILYTDGVTEANDKNEELFGEERLLEYVNSINYKTMEDILHGVGGKVDEFVGEAPQFDDITMIGLCYKGWNR